MIYCSQLRATPSADCNISHIAVGLSNYLILISVSYACLKLCPVRQITDQLNFYNGGKHNCSCFYAYNSIATLYIRDQIKSFMRICKSCHKNMIILVNCYRPRPLYGQNIKLKVKSCLKLSLNVFDLLDQHQSEKCACARCSNTASYEGGIGVY